MSNDDLGQFPTPPQSFPNPPEPTSTDVTAVPPSIDDDAPPTTLLEDINTPPTTEESSTSVAFQSSPDQNTPDTTFEATPDEIPSITQETPPTTAVPAFVSENNTYDDTPPESPTEKTPFTEPQHQETSYTPPETILETPHVTPPMPTEPPIAAAPTEIPATIPKAGPSFGPVILIGLLLVAGIGLAASVFLFAQSQQLKDQLVEITQTLDQQKTIITPTPTASEVEAITPSLSPTIVATISSTPTPFVIPTATPTATLTPMASATIMPLAAASDALRVAINHEPNAQLILIKTENATDPVTALTKYYFRQNLSTKKYFYVTINSKGESQIVSTAIYVTPDNNIPSLNDLVLGNKLGIDFDEALKLSTDLCSGTTCTTASVKAQYIKSGEIVIWQLTFDPQGTGENLVIQINAQTKEVLYKSAGFK